MLLFSLCSWSLGCHATCSSVLYTKLSTVVCSLLLVFAWAVTLLVPWCCIPNYLLLLSLYSRSLGCHATCSFLLYTKLSTAVCLFVVGVWVVMPLVPWCCIPNYLLLLFLYSWSLGCHATCSFLLHTKLSTSVKFLYEIIHICTAVYFCCLFVVGLWVVMPLVPWSCLPNYLLLGSLAVSQFALSCFYIPNRLLLCTLCSLATRTHDLSLYNSKTTQAKKVTQVDFLLFKTGADLILFTPRQLCHVLTTPS